MQKTNKNSNPNFSCVVDTVKSLCENVKVTTKEDNMNRRKTQILADLALVFVTLIWGATFVTVQEAIKFIEPYYFLTIRFSIAAIIMLLITNKRLKNVTKASLVKGIIIGIMLFAGYAFQTFGLKYTLASNAGFITGLSVVIVPVIVTITTQKFPGIIPVLGTLSATCGLALLTIDSSLKLNPGDLLVMLCAFSFAFHILLLGKYSPDNDPFALATIQIGTVALLSFIAALIKETPPPSSNFTSEVWGAILITSVLATALAFFIQTWTQKYTSPTHTAIILTMEPVFAAVFAYFLGGETFTMQKIFGACLILFGMLSSELSGNDHNETEEISEEPLKI